MSLKHTVRPAAHARRPSPPPEQTQSQEQTIMSPGDGSMRSPEAPTLYDAYNALTLELEQSSILFHLLHRLLEVLADDATEAPTELYELVLLGEHISARHQIVKDQVHQLWESIRQGVAKGGE